MPGGYEGTVGYLQLRAANVARQRAIADQQDIGNDSGAENDVGGKALGVVQQSVARAQHEQDLDKTLAAHMQQALTLKRLGLKPIDEEKRDAELAYKRAQTTHLGNQDSHLGVQEAQGQQKIDNKTLQDAASNDLKRLGIVVQAGGKFNPVTGESAFDIAPNATAGSGIAPVGQSHDPNSYALPKPEQVKVSEQIPESQKAVDSTQRALDAIEAVPESDFGVIAGGLPGKFGAASGIGLNDLKDIGAGLGIGDQEAAHKRRTATSEVNNVINDLNRFMNSARATDADRANIQKALAGVDSNNIFSAPKQQWREAIKIRHDLAVRELARQQQEMATHRRQISPPQAAPQAASVAAPSGHSDQDLLARARQIKAQNPQLTVDQALDIAEGNIPY
jgi:hypothetical protein